MSKDLERSLKDRIKAIAKVQKFKSDLTHRGLPEQADPGSPSKRVIDRNLTLERRRP